MVFAFFVEVLHMVGHIYQPPVRPWWWWFVLGANGYLSLERMIFVFLEGPPVKWLLQVYSKGLHRLTRALKRGLLRR